eukprot:scaffold7223_cov183-Skeletonema_menzelii.AAC.2
MMQNKVEILVPAHLRGVQFLYEDNTHAKGVTNWLTFMIQNVIAVWEQEGQKETLDNERKRKSYIRSEVKWADAITTSQSSSSFKSPPLHLHLRLFVISSPPLHLPPSAVDELLEIGKDDRGSIFSGDGTMC